MASHSDAQSKQNDDEEQDKFNDAWKNLVEIPATKYFSPVTQGYSTRYCGGVASSLISYKSAQFGAQRGSPVLRARPFEEIAIVTSNYDEQIKSNPKSGANQSS